MQKPLIDNRWLNFILDAADVIIISTDTEGVIRSLNHAALDRLGYQSDELIGVHTPSIIHDRDEVAARAKILSSELGREIEPGFEVFVARARMGIADENEWIYVRKDGTRFPVVLTVTALKDEEGHIEGFLGMGRDISLQHAMQAKIEMQQMELKQANAELLEANRRLTEIIQIDPLTQLLNRRGLHNSFEKELERIKREFSPLSLLLMDLDYFKSYNDSFGHLEGDCLLRELSHDLNTHTRAIDYVARFGGEEFVFLLPQTNQQVSEQIAERYRMLVEARPDRNRSVTASLGIATLDKLPEEGTMTAVFDRLMHEADQALYRAKDLGRNQVLHYDDVNNSE